MKSSTKTLLIVALLALGGFAVYKMSMASQTSNASGRRSRTLILQNGKRNRRRGRGSFSGGNKIIKAAAPGYKACGSFITTHDMDAGIENGSWSSAGDWAKQQCRAARRR